MTFLERLDKVLPKNVKGSDLDLKITYMYLMGGIMSMGGLVWGFLCLFFDIYIGSIIPFSYIGFTAINFLVFRQKRNFKSASFFQVLISLLLPFMMQWYLGGFLPSGAVMMWAILAVLGSLSFQSLKSSRLWIYLFIGLTAISSFEDIYRYENVTHQTTFLVINIAFIFTAIYYLVVYLIQVRERANKVLKEKNSLITSSIDYAKLIQESVIQDEETFTGLIPNSFVIYRPKDIVSGDFYWTKRLSEHQFHLVVADCTGHGVPGAFMSLLGINILNQVVPADHWLAPNLIFDRLNEQIIGTFKTDKAPAHGMDASIVSVHNQKKLLFFTGAKSRLFLLRNDASTPLIVNGKEHEPILESENRILYTIKGDRQSIGKSNEPLNPFSRNQIEYLRGDQIFLSSDGFFDQFCAANEKKYLRKRFCELIINFSEQQSADSKKNLIEHSLDNWQGKNEQTDDICVVGFTL